MQNRIPHPKSDHYAYFSVETHWKILKIHEKERLTHLFHVFSFFVEVGVHESMQTGYSLDVEFNSHPTGV